MEPISTEPEPQLIARSSTPRPVLPFQALSWEQVEDLQAKYGKNQVSISKSPKWYQFLWNCTVHPFNAILAVLAVTAVATGDFRTMAVMLLMVLLSVGLRFYQEFKSAVAAEALKKMVQNKVAVLRLYKFPEDRDPTFADVERMDDVIKQEIPLTDIVPGDLVVLSAGDMIPGDCMLIESRDLFVSQSALTGETLPLEKQHASPVPSLPPDDGPLDLNRIDLLLMGSSVVSGTAKAVVVRIGERTVFGELAKKLAKARPKTTFQKGINAVSVMFISIMLVMLPLVLIISGITQGDWFQAFLFTISVAVGLTPEMLPMIVNANLARGAYTMSQQKTIVKHLASIIDFGSIDVLCTDKTGTLTIDKVVLMKYLDLQGQESRQVLEMAYLNSHFQTGLKNLLDIAVIEHWEKVDPNHALAGSWDKMDELPFDFVRRRMSVLLRSKQSGERLMVTKGALEETLRTCVWVRNSAGAVELFSEVARNSATELGEQLNQDGLRVIAVAMKNLNASENCFDVQTERDLTFLGVLCFLDPPKESTAPALRELRERNIEVKVLTGDSPLVCKKVCQEVGLPIKSVVQSKDLQGLSDEQVADLAESGTIFAKLTPIEKAKLVTALRSRGHVVGFLGDGINDAAALKAADVGVSVDTAVDVAKEAADMILLEKSLLVLVRAVVEGRRTFCNTMKYVKMAVSSNFGNVFSVTYASAWLPFLPLLPVHIVFQNLLYDLSQLAIPWDNVDEESLQRPQTWSAMSIVRFMVCLGPLSSLFDATTFLFMWYYYGIQHSVPAYNAFRPTKWKLTPTMFQTAWFVEAFCTQALIVHMIRSPLIPLIQSRASWQLTLGTVITIAIAISLPFTPLASYLQMVPLPAFYFVYLISALLAYCLASQIVKRIYICVFEEWLGSGDLTGGKLAEKSGFDKLVAWLSRFKVFTYCL